MTRATFFQLSTLTLLLLLGGCRSLPTPAPANPAPIVAGEYEAMYQAAVATLRDHGFVVDRQDYRFGQITTKPLDSPTVFEPWRAHNTTSEQTLASTMGQLDRTVRVSLEAIEDVPEAYALRVEVQLLRQQIPLRRLNGSGKRNPIDTLREVPEEWQERGISASYHEPIGRDAEYEQRLIHEIIARAQGKH